MPATNYSRWVGRGPSKIFIRRNYSTGMATVRMGDITMKVKTEFLEDKLEHIESYQSKERFFNSFYYGTSEADAELQARYERNFDSAIRQRYMFADPRLGEYATQLWKSMTPDQRDRFSVANKKLVDKTFNYDDKSTERRKKRYRTGGETTAKTVAQDTRDLQSLVNEMENYAPKHIVRTLRQEYEL